MADDHYLNKIRAYCAYQERAPVDVRNKLFSYGLYGQKVDELMNTLHEEGFLDVRRYTEEFVRSKFFQKRWGKQKIRYHLFQKEIPEELIGEYLEDIPEEDYHNLLYNLLEQKNRQLSDDLPSLKRKEKLLRFASGKGYEKELIFKILYQLLGV